MQNWLELESRFQLLISAGQHLRADFQWGAAGEYASVAGISNGYVQAQFSALADMAGKLLLEALPKIEHTQAVLSYADHGKRWLYALKEWSGSFQHLHTVQQINDAGDDAGYIHTGQIDEVIAVSAVFCLHLHNIYPMKQSAKTEPHMTVNNYVVNSQVGLLNTGDISHVKSIAINVGRLQEQGQERIAQALNEILEAVATADSLNHDEKSELLDQVEELSKQATLHPEQRAKPGMIKAILGGIGAAAGTAASLSDLWSTWGPVIRDFFQL
ncbi:restriction endonuclease subunit S domain-containing protein [Hymenobacter pini]|uniref:hypothetical protein n=1 Tax=Hymenobacter pini TaxID=2880879 RepID=UPI001CF27D4B|nr:hypothetical protein [Hymenobacter pini]MCA8833154.1 hypothetical protein [Hymenobacter pini]